MAQTEAVRDIRLWGSGLMMRAICDVGQSHGVGVEMTPTPEKGDLGLDWYQVRLRGDAVDDDKACEGLLMAAGLVAFARGWDF